MMGFPGRLRKSPVAIAAVGNVRVSGPASWRCVVRSKSVKKKSLSLRIGPPTYLRTGSGYFWFFFGYMVGSVWK